jgi:redox-sensitive bicupin YhaK (pirin superfamily)
VINEDRVRPGQGFPTHGHRDMEILSFVLAGALEHRDSLGSGSVIRPGDVQRMSAGTGVTHSEFNHSDSEEVHFLQVWIVPAANGVAPGYEQKSLPGGGHRDRLRLVASPDGRDGSVTIHQNATVWAATLGRRRQIDHPITTGRRAWLQVARGAITLNDRPLEAGDGAAIRHEPSLSILGREEESEILLFDLA